MKTVLGFCACLMLVTFATAAGAAASPTTSAREIEPGQKSLESAVSDAPMPSGPDQAPALARGCGVCPPGALEEGEPDCTDGYVDVTNGGCSGGAPLFTDIPCGSPMTVCGTYGGYCHPDGCVVANFRDTDWYRITVSADDLPLPITWRATGESDMLVGVVDGTTGCSPLFATSSVAGTCQQAAANFTIATAGDWYLFVSTNTFGAAAGPCGQVYEATLEGYECAAVPAEDASWGRVKASFRE